MKFHLELDTGLNRFGVRQIELNEAIAIIKQYALVPDGVLTHYSSSPTDTTLTKKEFELFSRMLAALKSAGIQPRYIHASNSAAAY